MMDSNVLMTIILCLTVLTCIPFIGFTVYICINQGLNRWKEKKFAAIVFDRPRGSLIYKEPGVMKTAKNTKVRTFYDEITDTVTVEIRGDFNREELKETMFSR